MELSIKRLKWRFDENSVYNEIIQMIEIRILCIAYFRNNICNTGEYRFN